MEHNEFYWYECRCEACGYIESYPSAKRSAVDWFEFKRLLLSSKEAQINFRECKICKKYTRQILVSFDKE